MKTILLPTNFSEVSDNAIQYAVEMAKLTQSKLILLHIYHVPIITSDTPMVIPSMEALGEECMQSLQKIKSEISFKHGPGIQVECICRCGLEVDEIEEYTEKNKVDLIITAMQEAGEFAEKIIGSVTTSLMRRSKCPVLAIDSQAKFRPIKKIALACDYKEIKTKTALDPLKEIVKLFQSHLYIVNVLRESKELVPTTDQAVAGVKLDHLLEDINHSFHFEENKDVVQGINDFAGKHSVDMIVMVPRSHSLIENIFHEPSTKKMAFHTHVPLLSIHE